MMREVILCEREVYVCARGDGFYHSWCCAVIYIICPAAVHPLWLLSALLSSLHTFISVYASVCVGLLNEGQHACNSTEKKHTPSDTIKQRMKPLMKLRPLTSPFTHADTNSVPVRGSLHVTLSCKPIGCTALMNYTFSVKL